MTKTTISAGGKKFARKSLSEYGKGDSTYTAAIATSGNSRRFMQAEEAEFLNTQRDRAEELGRLRREVYNEVNDRYRSLSAEQCEAILRILRGQKEASK